MFCNIFALHGLLTWYDILENWDEEQIYEFIHDKGHFEVKPYYYKYMKSKLNCAWGVMLGGNCIAFKNENLIF